MFKTPQEIAMETPLSITSTDNAVYKVLKDVEVKIYATQDYNGVKYSIDTLEKAELKKGYKLRLLQCHDDDRDNHYRWGDGNRKVIVADKYMQHISGTLGPKA